CEEGEQEGNGGERTRREGGRFHGMSVNRLYEGRTGSAGVKGIHGYTGTGVARGRLGVRTEGVMTTLPRQAVDEAPGDPMAADERDAEAFFDAEPDPEAGELTRLLESLETGDSEAADRLFPLVYDQLRGLAAAL